MALSQQRVFAYLEGARRRNSGTDSAMDPTINNDVSPTPSKDIHSDEKMLYRLGDMNTLSLSFPCPSSDSHPLEFLEVLAGSQN
jgi:hypothetical protein